MHVWKCLFEQMLEYLAKVDTCVYKKHLVMSTQSLQAWYYAAQWLLQFCVALVSTRTAQSSCRKPLLHLVWCSRSTILLCKCVTGLSVFESHGIQQMQMQMAELLVQLNYSSQTTQIAQDLAARPLQCLVF